jgi:hypothetical protein
LFQNFGREHKDGASPKIHEEVGKTESHGHKLYRAVNLEGEWGGGSGVISYKREEGGENFFHSRFIVYLLP